MKFLAAFAFTAFTLALANPVQAEDKKDKGELKGQLVKLVGEKTEFTTEPGGLILLPIPDSGSRPPQDIKVDGGELKKLGTVQGSQDDEGRPKAGGGYTWVLFTAEKAGTYKVKVTYTENGGDGKKVVRNYTVKVEKP